VGTLRPSPTHPATQDSTGVVHISRRHKQLKVPPEALTFFFGQQLSIWNHHEKIPVQEQMTKVPPEALAKFVAQPVTMWNYYENCQVQEHIKKKTPEAMPNFNSIAIHLNLPSISTEKRPRYSSVAADIIK
jgi:hypothetical protein